MPAGTQLVSMALQSKALWSFTSSLSLGDLFCHPSQGNYAIVPFLSSCSLNIYLGVIYK